MRRITKISKKKVSMSREDWDEMWVRIRQSIPEVFPGQTRGTGAVESLQAASGGDCDDFCGAACADDGGCDLSFGSSGECGALCNSGDVYLQEEV